MLSDCRAGARAAASWTSLRSPAWLQLARGSTPSAACTWQDQRTGWRSAAVQLMRSAGEAGVALRRWGGSQPRAVKAVVTGPGEGGGLLVPDQRDGGAAETAAGHAGTAGAGGEGGLDGGVELGAGDLVALAQRGVGGGYEVAEAGDVADGERMCCLADAGDLGDDVAGATDQNVVVQARQRGG